MTARSVKAETENSESAFTLIELLVVIAVVSLLLAIVLPTLTRVKERTRRVVCQSNIRSFHIAIAAYAADHNTLLPKGGLGDFHNYTIVMAPEIYEQLGGEFVCPNLLNPFKGGAVNIFNGGSYQNYQGETPYYLLGYNYLGGIPDTPWAFSSPAQAEWKSPKKITENPRLPIIAELNTWTSNTYKLTFAPHGYWGPIHESGDSTNQSYNGTPSDGIGAAGGHICNLDGSIQWKDIEDMKIHKAGTDFNLWAFW